MTIYKLHYNFHLIFVIPNEYIYYKIVNWYMFIPFDYYVLLLLRPPTDICLYLLTTVSKDVI